MNNSKPIAISVNGISKAYTISHLQTQNNSNISQNKRGRFFWQNQKHSSDAITKETFWALKDIYFEVPVGQVLGIIGRNGAGKSTFLKILSQIIEPSQGFVDIRGRVGSLLEVGTGFHPELTGRENIYLNGTLLGMRKRQIDDIFDQIVDFAEVERFIDTPVKRYSSGMYVRLAFAVAAYLRPDVLIIDEVLSVGDASFQEKCLGRMQSLGDAGRTVIFVSHNMDAVSALCDRTIVFNQGRLHFDGTPQAAADAYYSLCASGHDDLIEYKERGGSRPNIIKNISTEYCAADDVPGASCGKLLARVCGDIPEDLHDYVQSIQLALSINQENGTRIGTYLTGKDDEPIKLSNGSFMYRFTVTDAPLVPGKYYIDVSIINRGDTLDSIQLCSPFRIHPPAAISFETPHPTWGPIRLCCEGKND